MLVVRARDVLFGAADVLPVALAAVPPDARVALKQLVERGFVLGVGQKLPVAVLLGALERDNGRIAPSALQVRCTPRRFGTRSRTGLTGNGGPRQRDGNNRRRCQRTKQRQ